MLKASIYKIVNTVSGLIYIGSTTTTINRRLSAHKMCNKFAQSGGNVKRIPTSHKVMSDNNYYIAVIKEVECADKKELLRKEGEIIRQYREQYDGLVVNRLLAGRTPQEYCKDNAAKRCELSKIYNRNNHDKYLEYQKEYRQKKKTTTN